MSAAMSALYVEHWPQPMAPSSAVTRTKQTNSLQKVSSLAMSGTAHLELFVPRAAAAARYAIFRGEDRRWHKIAVTHAQRHRIHAAGARAGAARPGRGRGARRRGADAWRSDRRLRRQWPDRPLRSDGARRDRGGARR